MKTIQTKIELKRKKKVIALLNHISSLEETIIKIIVVHYFEIYDVILRSSILYSH